MFKAIRLWTFFVGFLALYLSGAYANATCPSEANIEKTVNIIAAELSEHDYQKIAGALHQSLKAQIEIDELKNIENYGKLITGIPKLELEYRLVKTLKKFASNMGSDVKCQNINRMDQHKYNADSRINWSCTATVKGTPLQLSLDLNDGQGFLRAAVSREVTDKSLPAPIAHKITALHVERYGKIDSDTGLTVREVVLYENNFIGSILLEFYKPNDLNKLMTDLKKITCVN